MLHLQDRKRIYVLINSTFDISFSEIILPEHLSMNKTRRDYLQDVEEPVVSVPKVLLLVVCSVTHKDHKRSLKIRMNNT